MNKNTVILLLGAIVIIAGAYVFASTSNGVGDGSSRERTQQGNTSVAEVITLTGTYECLPLLGGAPSTSDCAFGIKTDAGEYYAVNFGASAGSMADFKSNARITAKGTIILRDQLRPNSWEKYEAQGLFTVLERL